MILSAACALMVTGNAINSDAGTGDDRAGQAKPSESSPSLKVTFKMPNGGDKAPLVLGRRTKLHGLVRVERTGKVEPQEKLVISFIRVRDKALAGQFLAMRKRVGPDTFEYEAELIAPPAAAKYELVTTLDEARASNPKPRASMKVEVVE